MKREHTPATRSLRAVSLAITLVSLVAFSSIAYSVYEDFSGAIDVLKQGQSANGVSERTVTQGNNVTLYVNVTLPNRGLYPFNVGISCIPSDSHQYDCRGANVTIPAGGEGTLHFVASIANFTTLAGQKGRLTLSLASFASTEMTIDLGALGGKK